ncbi:ABC transporter ATP-binding protein [Sporosarcina oncorhynchi]|uniref:ABC transporter ATP-binding protein n=1 Tax=Sporosarcina oncorhynchi TaxID=3056444 RepID=A0ABZ0L6F0_9BACL|nr:ABC transporter ATP-binding protein [Sporosarcina sp. T2O-4]WOV88073.1 ABC transporter ATP-binding protein [Sporosarcina sp. T2O-4]
METILKVQNLKTYFYADGKEIPAVDDVSFEIKQGETLGIVGESGSGKSITSLSILSLIPKPPGKIVGGEILFKGENILTYNEKQMRELRGNKISMIFQEPMTSLNPVFTVGNQIMETLVLHQKLSKKQARLKAIEMLQLVGIPLAEKRIDEYPHQLSGGMRQRVMIAMALSCNPELLIADEPTTALDVTTQAQILELMKDLKVKLNMATLLITHDLGVVSESADRVAVMYLGRIVEYADVESFFDEPLHPYSIGLLDSIPSMYEEIDRLSPIPGQVPHPTDLRKGCRFHTRCPHAKELCRQEEPELMAVGDKKVRCWLYDERYQAEEV